MHRFALIPLEAVRVGDRLGRGINRELGHARRPFRRRTASPYFPWSV
jgi:hypothetical protein